MLRNAGVHYLASNAVLSVGAPVVQPVGARLANLIRHVARKALRRCITTSDLHHIFSGKPTSTLPVLL